jgi:hypothetical protein
LVRTGKGILAADESVSTMNARLARAGVVCTADNRRIFQEMLVTTPHLREGVSGVIVCDETFGQRLGSGETFPEGMTARRPLSRHQGRCRDRGRRDHPERTGTVAVTVVPIPGREVTSSLPPTSSARSVMLRRP